MPLFLRQSPIFPQHEELIDLFSRTAKLKPSLFGVSSAFLQPRRKLSYAHAKVVNWY